MMPEGEHMEQQHDEIVDLQIYLRSTYYLDADHPAIRAFAEQSAAGAGDATAKAVRLYYAVRDRLLYDPYSIDYSPEACKASAVLARGRGYCVAKACVLTAASRALKIPARLGFADVRNHLATERLRRLMGTDIFYYHGYTEFYLGGKWVKATPAFNIELCRKFGVVPLEFDGRSDSLFQPFDLKHRRHMEYINDRGHRADLPYDEIREAMFRYYAGGAEAAAGGDFHAEAEAENK
jgi:transglutaminase-like putative cysteine protease